MSEEYQVSVDIPADIDGFLRRECPTCERQFKWYAHDEGDPSAEAADQYFCPLCGEPAPLDAWWTQEQADYAKSIAIPHFEEAIGELITESLKGLPGLSLSGPIDLDVGSVPDPPVGAPDMNIVESPCHPNEPVKVPNDQLVDVDIYCLVCGAPFRV